MQTQTQPVFCWCDFDFLTKDLEKVKNTSKDTCLFVAFRMCEQSIKVAEIELVLAGLNNDLKQSVVHCICTKAFIK